MLNLGEHHADHPHARGENVFHLHVHVRPSGPSPRAWGEPRQEGPPTRAARTIPTRVGRTFLIFVFVFIFPDHPHARGENSITPTPAGSLSGPSPRAWGEHPREIRAQSFSRTIPTRVGRTEGLTVFVFVFRDHPHARGENSLLSFCRLGLSGPSPRAWGELFSRPRSARYRRTIPTRVGRTASHTASAQALADHPHARGENHFRVHIHFRSSGPSPRAWGEQITVLRDREARRTIPTRVGRTVAPMRHRTNSADHPHARGENFASASTSSNLSGPSPRAWGERNLVRGFGLS